MKALLISYELSKSSQNQKTLLHKALYGYRDHSNNGRYKYEREGLLSKIPSIKLNRGVFIIKQKDSNKIMPILKKNKVILKTLIVSLPESMLKKI